MRARIVGLTLVGVGALAVAAAVPAGSWSPLLPADLPLDERSATQLVGEQVTYLDPATLEARTSEDVTVSTTVRGDDDTGDADGTLIATTTTVACLDRRTAEAVDCVTESVDGERVDVQGLAVRFPSGTARRDYPVWDAAARQAFPARFAGAESFRDLQVYRFEQEVPAQVIGSVPVPDNPPTEIVHSATRSWLVEPVSGVVLEAQDSPVTVLRGPDGSAGATLLAGTFTTSEGSVDDAVALAEDVRADRGSLRTALTWGAAGTGAALLLAGGLLVARSRTTRTDPAEDEPVREPVPAGGPRARPSRPARSRCSPATGSRWSAPASSSSRCSSRPGASSVTPSWTWPWTRWPSSAGP